LPFEDHFKGVTLGNASSPEQEYSMFCSLSSTQWCVSKSL